MILHTWVDHGLRTSIDLWVYRSKVKVKFGLWTLHRLRKVNFTFWPTLVVYHTWLCCLWLEEDSYWCLDQEVKGKAAGGGGGLSSLSIRKGLVTITKALLCAVKWHLGWYYRLSLSDRTNLYVVLSYLDGDFGASASSRRKGIHHIWRIFRGLTRGR